MPQMIDCRGTRQFVRERLRPRFKRVERRAWQFWCGHVNAQLKMEIPVKSLGLICKAFFGIEF